MLLHGSHGPWLESEIAAGSLLARAGLVVLLFDKRDVDDAQELPHRYTLDQLTGDAAAAVAWLRRRPEVDPRRVGIFGVSEGGWVAPHLAARLPSIAFVITLSAPGLSYAELVSRLLDLALERHRDRPGSA